MSVLIKKFNAAQKKIKNQEGMTLVEIIIAFFIISLITGVVIHSSILAINTSRINKTKTLALAIINEEIEKMRAMEYDELGLVGRDPEGVLEEEVTTGDGFLVTYSVSWADEDKTYKQVSVSAYKEPMLKNLEAITRIYPLSAIAQNGEEPGQYPPPQNLALEQINSDILLSWESPDTDLTINEYRVYRDGSLIDTTMNLNYTDSPEQSQSHVYYVTAFYSDNTESEPSNEV
ncbi:MAG: prepilin-type N-terminal cleavage/methylation domain-containing protein, partial [Actinomycetota bacterium]